MEGNPLQSGAFSMRSGILPAVGLSAAALVAATTFAGTASAHNTTPNVVHQGTVANTAPASTAKGACYKQNKNDSGVGIVSQKFGDDPGYNSEGAADFTVKKRCTIGTVVANGVYFNGTGPATSETVTFYKAKKGVPGKVIKAQTVKGKDSAGTFTIALKKAVKLKKGSYFVSVVANMDLSAGGEWGWELTSDQSGNIDQWQNDGGAFGVCPTWGNVTDCVGYGNDYMVVLSK